MPDPRVPRADLVRRAQPFVGERRRHPDVDDRHVGLVLVDLAQQLLGGRRLRRHVDPGAPQERGDALAHERAVVGDHDAHGSSAVTTVPAPRRARDEQVPVQRLDAVGQAVQAGPVRGVRAADAVVGDLDRDAGRRPRQAHRRRRRLGVLADVGQGLAGHEVHGELDGLAARAPARRTTPRWPPSTGSPATRAPRRDRDRARPGGCRARARGAPAASGRARRSPRPRAAPPGRGRAGCPSGASAAAARARRAAAGRRRAGRARAGGARRRRPRRCAGATPAPRRAEPPTPPAGARSPAPSSPRRGPPRPSPGRRRATRRRRSPPPRGRRARSARSPGPA